MLPLIHHPAYDAATVPDKHRFPMRKYSLVAAELRSRGYTFDRPDPAPMSWLKRVHRPEYVDAVMDGTLDPKAMRKIGFDVTSAVAQRAQASVGGTVLAARRALERGAAVNLAGGSHHASTEGGAGFCVFNDVAVAARQLIAENRVADIAVIDLDVHQGDGTALIFAHDPSVFTASMHCEKNWPRFKPSSDLDRGLPVDLSDADYLSELEALLTSVFDNAKPDLVFYNAGVDPHTDDRLGLLSLSDEGLKARERAVAEACHARGIPVCGVLGGGYQADASAVAHRHTFLVEAFASQFTSEPIR
ncbi:MAG: histone deacetylase [Pseudomonadota bacterium]